MTDLEQFMETTRNNLNRIADVFGVDISNAKNKIDVAEAIVADGVTWKMWREHGGEQEETKPVIEDEPKEEGDEPVKKDAAESFEKTVLVKMVRANGTFETHGLRFSKAHPYLPVTQTVADELITKVGGFRIATTEEVKNYYS